MKKRPTTDTSTDNIMTISTWENSMRDSQWRHVLLLDKEDDRPFPLAAVWWCLWRLCVYTQIMHISSEPRIITQMHLSMDDALMWFHHVWKDVALSPSIHWLVLLGIASIASEIVNHTNHSLFVLFDESNDLWAEVSPGTAIVSTYTKQEWKLSAYIILYKTCYTYKL